MFSDSYFVAPNSTREVDVEGIIRSTVNTPYVSELGFVVGGGGSSSVDSAQVVELVTTTVTKSYVDNLGVNAATLSGTVLSALATVSSIIPTITSTVTKSFVDALGIDAATIGGGVAVGTLATVASLVPTITSTITKSFVDGLGIDATTLNGLASSAFATVSSIVPTITATVDKAFVDALGVNAATLEGTSLSGLATTSSVSSTVTTTVDKAFVDNLGVDALTLGGVPVSSLALRSWVESQLSKPKPWVVLTNTAETLHSSHFNRLLFWNLSYNSTYALDASVVSLANYPSQEQFEIEIFNNSVSYTIQLQVGAGCVLLARNTSTAYIIPFRGSAKIRYTQQSQGGTYVFALVRMSSN